MSPAGIVVNQRYRLVKLLGRGGMGDVYLAEDLAHESCPVALKALRPTASASLEAERFRNEFQYLSQLRHPHLAEVYDFGVTADLPTGDSAETPFFTMEYVRGDDLYIATAGMPWEDVTEVLVQICRALEFIHSRGFVHRDVKPGNILISSVAGAEPGAPRFHARLLDFGLAGAHEPEHPNDVRGTVPYLAPEVLKGLPPDRRADLYSLGVVFYQVVTRRLPFDGDTALQIARKHLHDDPVAPHTWRKDVPRPIESLILRLLAKEPSDRLPSANLIIQSLSALTGRKYEIETRTTRECYVMSGRFVGRDGPLLQLRDAFEGLVRAAGQSSATPDAPKLLSRLNHCILITGERGLGKRRLLREFKHHVQFAGCLFEVVDPAPEGSSALAPFLTLVRRALHEVQNDDRALDRYADGLARLLPDLALGRGGPAALALEPDHERARLVGTLVDVLFDFATRRPLVLCVQGLAGLDPLSLELLQSLAHRLHALRREALVPPATPPGGDDTIEDEPMARPAAGATRPPPLLLLVTCEIEHLEGRPAGRLLAELTVSGSAEEIRLRRLTLGEVTDLIKSMLGVQLLPEALPRLLHQQSAGNPQVVEEIMRALVEDGAVAYDRGAWRVFEDRLHAIALPPGLAQLVRRRLERVTGRDRDVMIAVALLQRPAPLRLLAAVVSDRVDVLARLGSLDRRGLLQRTDAADPSWEFVHAAARDWVLQGLAPATRSEWHDRIGAALTPAAVGDGDADECAWHLLRGLRPEMALPHLLIAAERAQARCALPRVIDACRSALPLIPAHDVPTREQVLERLAGACALAGQYEESVRTWETLLALAGDAPDERALLWRARLADACAKQGDPERALREVATGFRSAGGRASPALAQIYRQQAWLLVQQGRCDEAIAAGRAGLDLVERLGDETLQGPFYNVLGVADLNRGEIQSSKALLERAQDLCERHRDTQGLGNALNNLAILYAYTGHHRKAREVLHQVLRLRERAGDRWGMVLAIGNLGVTAHELGENDVAMDCFRRSLALRTEIGMTHGVPSILLNIGSIEMSRGQVTAALRSWEHCLDLVHAGHDLQGEVVVRANLAHLFAFCGALGRAEHELGAARALAERLGLSRERAVLHGVAGEIAAARGEVAEARRQFALAEAEYRDLRSNIDVALSRVQQADAAWRDHDPAQARALLTGLEDLLEGRPPPPLAGLLALVQARLEPAEAAEARVQEGLRQTPAGEFPDLEWELHCQRARVCEALGRADDARVADRRALEILHTLWEGLPSTWRDRFAAVGHRRAAWPHFLRRQAEGRLAPELDDFVIRLAVKGETMEPRDDSGEVDATRRRLQVAINLLKEENKNLVRLVEINKKLNSELDLTRLLEFIMDAAVELTRAEKGFLLRNDEQGKVSIAVARNFERSGVDRPEQQMSRSIAEEVARSGKAVVTTDATQDSRFNLSESVRDLHLASVLCVPLRARDRVLGSLYIENRAARGFFSEKDREMLEAFADQAAIAFENARLYSDNLAKQKELEVAKDKLEVLNRQLEQTNQSLETRVQTQQEELVQAKQNLEARTRELGLKYSYENIVGRSAKMKEVFALLDRITNSHLPVVIHGESGTGKELVARAIHFNGIRKHNQFAAENCAALAETLLESELFGYMRGAFTGAEKDRKGLFEVAHQGTLFLDEIGDMSSEMQKKLLRVLESGELRRVGGKETIKVDVRIIAASNKDLFAMTREGTFREDLYYRLNVFQVKLPPLRDRKEDLPALVEHLLRQFADESKTAVKKVDAGAVQLLREYGWPGNIRELKNVITGVASLTDDPVLTARNFADKIPNAVVGPDGEPPPPEYLTIDEYTRRFILEHQDHLTDIEMADYLGISRKTLWEKRKKWGIAR